MLNELHAHSVNVDVFSPKLAAIYVAHPLHIAVPSSMYSCQALHYSYVLQATMAVVEDWEQLKSSNLLACSQLGQI